MARPKGFISEKRKPFGESARNCLYSLYRRVARKRGLTWNLTMEEFIRLTKGSCAYCGIEPSQMFKPNHASNGSYIYNGIDRRDNERGYEPDNVVSCCTTCNVAKRSMTVEQFRTWIRRVYAKFVDGF